MGRFFLRRRASCRRLSGHQISARHTQPKHSGDGTFLLRLTYLEAENGKDAVYTYVGRRYTQRGIPSDKDAVVWQLVADRDEDVYNFLCDKDAQTLTLLNRDFEKNESGLNYSLTKIR